MVCTIAIQMPHSNDHLLAKCKCLNKDGCSIDSSLCNYCIRVFIMCQPLNVPCDKSYTLPSWLRSLPNKVFIGDGLFLI